MLSQNITGKVYDSNTTVKGILIRNINSNIKTLTDNDGNFNIEAQVNDSILFRSVFYKEHLIVLTTSHFKEIVVIELKKTINELDEVVLKNDTKPKKFDIVEYEANFHAQIKEDMKRRPYLYGLPPSSNIDFVKIAAFIGKLFKGKNKIAKEEPIITATYKELDSLFTNDHFFNNKLLTDDFKISNKYRSLFFDYCDARRINKKLLLKEHKFLLLDTLINCSKAFKLIIDKSKKE